MLLKLQGYQTFMQLKDIFLNGKLAEVSMALKMQICFVPIFPLLGFYPKVIIDTHQDRATSMFALHVYNGGGQLHAKSPKQKIPLDMYLYNRILCNHLK